MKISPDLIALASQMRGFIFLAVALGVGLTVERFAPGRPQRPAGRVLNLGMGLVSMLIGVLSSGSIGALVIPGTKMIIGGGKENVIYLCKQGNMGKFNAADNSQIPQTFRVSQQTSFLPHGLLKPRSKVSNFSQRWHFPRWRDGPRRSRRL